MKRLWKRLFLIVLGLSLAAGLSFGAWAWSLNSEIKEKLSSRRFLPPTEFYSAPLAFFSGDRWTPGEIRDLLLDRGYSESPADRPLSAGRFRIAEGEECQTLIPAEHGAPDSTCLLFGLQDTPDPLLRDERFRLQAFLWIDDRSVLAQTLHGNPLALAGGVFLEPRLFAQYLGATPVLQTWTPLGETPSACLNAVLAIEDSNYLEHGGVSFFGIARAALKNLLRGRVAQGGSTITQQMVKNYFLTSERTFQRKAKEIVMSLLLELHADKDEIFETYLNIIYMGQSGPFEVRGFGAAARHYFQKDLAQLDLHECSLLAAILNSPGSFDPDRKPENALKRRNRVLDRMTELGQLSSVEAEEAKALPLRKIQRTALWETAPYYIQAALRQIQSQGLSSDGLRIFTGLVPEHQAAAQKAVQSRIEQLEKENPRIKKISGKKIDLEGVLLSMDLRTNWVSAAVGGRSFRRTQYNRILEGHRQIGSLMKPFVFLAALEKIPDLNALTPIEDAKFTHKYGRQSWSPENYDRKFHGQVPLYVALKNSYNAATASIGIKAGLDEVIETARAAGAVSELKPLPSLTLGAFELYPTEVLDMYATLGRLGTRVAPVWVRAALYPSGEIAFEHRPEPRQELDPAVTAQVVGILKQTVQSGTAQGISRAGFFAPAAGKTGTTSDSRDAWFAGFTPARLTVAWLGYDQKETHGLTGASGPVPIWIDFMKNVAAHDSLQDFAWPESVRLERLQPDGEPREIELVLPVEATDEPARPRSLTD